MAGVRFPFLLRLLAPWVTWRYVAKRKVVYLTFDDGPIPESTPWTLDLLEEKGVKATFFCVGDNVRKYPNLYARILKQGHGVGNHSYNHINGWTSLTSNYIYNIDKAAHLVDSDLFRPPQGLLRLAQAKHLSQRYKLIMWDVLSGDYRVDITPEECLKRVVDYARPGSIIVFHNHVKSESNMRWVLPRAIDILRDRGYDFDLCY